MRAFLFSFWYLPDSRTSVNRIRYFKKIFEGNGVDVNLIYCNDHFNPLQEKETKTYQIPKHHFLFTLSSICLEKNWLFFYKVIHFFYLVLSKRDVYDFYRNYRKNEPHHALNLTVNDVIITSSPPYSSLNIGFYLKRKYGVKWVLDYRDPWTLGYPTIGFSIFADKLRRWIQRNVELKFLESADYIITVSESLKQTFPEKFQKKIHVIKNGANYDEMDFNKIVNRPDVFSIVYAGTIYPQQLQSNLFFKSIREFIDSKKIIPSSFKVHFIGSAHSTQLLNMIAQFELDDFVSITERVDLPVLYDYMYNASMFLQLKYGKRDKIITSKQYEYLAMQKPILLPETDNGDIAESILNNNAGYVCNNQFELLEKLNFEYERFMNKEDVQIYRNAPFLNTVSRNAESLKLVNLLYPNKQHENELDVLLSQKQ